MLITLDLMEFMREYVYDTISSMPNDNPGLKNTFPHLPTNTKITFEDFWTSLGNTKVNSFFFFFFFHSYIFCKGGSTFNESLINAIDEKMNQKMTDNPLYQVPLFYLHWVGAKHILDKVDHMRAYHEHILEKFNMQYVLDFYMDMRMILSVVNSTDNTMLSLNWVASNMIDALNPTSDQFKK